jgi:hypothetical protein
MADVAGGSIPAAHQFDYKVYRRGVRGLRTDAPVTNLFGSIASPSAVVTAPCLGQSTGR